MNKERNISVKTNPLPPTRLQSGAGDLSSAEMPEVIVVADNSEDLRAMFLRL